MRPGSLMLALGMAVGLQALGSGLVAQQPPTPPASQAGASTTRVITREQLGQSTHPADQALDNGRWRSIGTAPITRVAHADGSVTYTIPDSAKEPYLSASTSYTVVPNGSGGYAIRNSEGQAVTRVVSTSTLTLEQLPQTGNFADQTASTLGGFREMPPSTPVTRSTHSDGSITYAARNYAWVITPDRTGGLLVRTPGGIELTVSPFADAARLFEREPSTTPGVSNPTPNAAPGANTAPGANAAGTAKAPSNAPAGAPSGTEPRESILDEITDTSPFVGLPGGPPTEEAVKRLTAPPQNAPPPNTPPGPIGANLAPATGVVGAPAGAEAILKAYPGCAAPQCYDYMPACIATDTCADADLPCLTAGTCGEPYVPQACISGASCIDLSQCSGSECAGGPTAGDARDPSVQVMIIRLVMTSAGNRSPANPLAPIARSLWQMFWRSAAPLHSSLGASAIPAPRNAQGGGAQRNDGGVRTLLTSLGTSTGEAFRIQVINDGPIPIRLGGDGIVVEPLKQAAAQQAARQMQRAAGRSPVTATLSGYCLEFLRHPPSAGTLFRVAGRDMQQRFEPMRRILRAADRVARAGLLNPDSNAATYSDSIAQWALWATEQKFTQASFEKAFLEHTQKNVRAAGQQWTGAMETAVRGLVPNRWADISRVLRASSSGRR